MSPKASDQCMVADATDGELDIETSGCSPRIATAQAHGRLLFKFASTKGEKYTIECLLMYTLKTAGNPNPKP